jgi:hypothetical protein
MKRYWCTSSYGDPVMEPDVRGDWVRLEDALAELVDLGRIAKDRNVMIGTLGQEIERLKDELTALTLDRDALVRDREGWIEQVERMRKDLAALDRKCTALAYLQYGSADPLLANMRIAPTAECTCATCVILRMAGSPAEAPQAPIARLMVADGFVTWTHLKAPGLPDGMHDLYCEPEATAPYLRSQEREP